MRGQKPVWALILLMGGMALLISLGLFYNMGVFVDEFGLTIIFSFSAIQFFLWPCIFHPDHQTRNTRNIHFF